MHRLWSYHVMYFLGVIALGFAMLFLSTQTESKLLATMLDHLGAALLVVGGFGAYEKWVVERKFLEHVAALFRVSSTVTAAGLRAVYSDPRDCDFRDLICTSRALALVLNDGRKWLSDKFSEFDERFKRKNHVTELFVVNPDGAFVELLAKKTEDDVPTIRDKIAKSISNLRSQFQASPRLGVLRMYYLPLFPTHAVFCGDDRAVMTLYTIASSRRSVPTLEVYDSGPQSLFYFIKQDIDTLRKTSILVYDSENDPDAGPSV